MKNIAIDYVDVSGESCLSNRTWNEARERNIAKQNAERKAAAAAREAKYAPVGTTVDYAAIDTLDRIFGD